MEKNKELLDKFLEGESSVPEIQQLLKMLHHPASWEDAYTENWERANGVIPSSIDKRMRNAVRTKTKPRVHIAWRRVWNVAAVVFILLFSGISVYLWQEQKIINQYSDMIVTVPRAQKYDLTLPDGTHVLLNSDSELKYGRNFNGRERRVELQGEAFFEVAQNSDAPFVVSVGDLSVTALGTSFNVKYYESDNTITTYLMEGKVLVKSPHESMELLPGQCISYNQEVQAMRRTTVDNERIFTAWHNNLLIMEDEPLEEIIKKLERQYNIEILIADETLKSQKYNGTIENNSLVNVLELFALTSNLQYRFQGDKLILFQNRMKN